MPDPNAQLPTFDITELHDLLELPDLCVDVDTNGVVRDVVVRSARDTATGRAATDAIRKLTFIPGRKDGLPVRVCTMISMIVCLQR